jgi:hypothetical protein
LIFDFPVAEVAGRQFEKSEDERKQAPDVCRLIGLAISAIIISVKIQHLL